MADSGWKALHDPNMLSCVLERWAESLPNETPFEMEFHLRGADGIYRWFLTRVSPFRDPEGKVAPWYGTNTNIDEQRRLLQSLSAARDHLEKRVEERTAELKAANQSLRDLSARLLQVQDDERRRLARELHDSVGQILAALSMNTGAVQGSQLTVEVRDNGKGVPSEKRQELVASGRAVVGFGGILERLRQLGGTLSIQSNETGTVVSTTLQLT